MLGRYLAQVGWKVNSREFQGRSVLRKAAFAGYAVAIRALLKLEADPLAKDVTALTPLDTARRWNKPAAVKVLARSA